jgi:adenosylhomocysteine nucleosidase
VGTIGIIGIIAALEQEIRHLIRDLENVRTVTTGSVTIHQGELSGRPVILAVSGAGKRAAERGAAALVEHFRPSIIVSTGFAGGLSEEATAGTIVYGSDLVDEAGGRETFPFPAGSAILPGEIRGVVLTTRHFVSAVNHRKELRDRFGAAAVDMESIHIARIARREAIPFVVARVISDDLSAELPVMRSVTDGDGRIDIRRAVPYFLRHPGTVVPFVRFIIRLDAHAVTLDACLRRLIMSLPAG